MGRLRAALLAALAAALPVLASNLHGWLHTVLAAAIGSIAAAAALSSKKILQCGNSAPKTCRQPWHTPMQAAHSSLSFL